MTAMAGWAAALPRRARPMAWLLALAAVGVLAGLRLPESTHLGGLCGRLGFALAADAFLVVTRIWSPGALALGWLLMLVAMMPPLLAQPVAHIWRSSFPARRARALALFALAYAALWLAMGVLLLPAAILLRIALPEAQAVLLVLLLALAWSASPPAQVARNACHRLRRIGAFGIAADRDCVRQGLLSGAACIGACWPWMLLPLVIDGLHLAVMALVGLYLFAERLSPGRPAQWQWPPGFFVLAAASRKVRGRP